MTYQEALDELDAWRETIQNEHSTSKQGDEDLKKAMQEIIDALSKGPDA